MIQEGDAAPNIKLETDTGESFDLKAMRGKKVVLFFYPKASTPGCTVEACEFRDTYKKFEKKGVVVLGISRDTPKAQTNFKEKQRLPFTLLCDVDHKAVQDYGVWKEKNMYGKKVMGIERTTFVIDEQGKIAKIFRKVKPEGHAEEVLAAV
ncbi:MAG TPA: thioredoxin-dependent thiol peroxidase [Bryobacteraceae bacterium]|nr:thioredoxin-dependent thiol peroxidase [Bryobacteraceae bacterium]